MQSLLQLLSSATEGKHSHRQYVNEWVGLCANKTLFTKIGGAASFGPRAVACHCQRYNIQGTWSLDQGHACRPNRQQRNLKSLRLVNAKTKTQIPNLAAAGK